MDRKLAQLLALIEDKGYIGAGPMRLTQDPNFIALKASLFGTKEPEEPKSVKVAAEAIKKEVRK